MFTKRNLLYIAAGYAVMIPLFGLIWPKTIVDLIKGRYSDEEI